jgi:hypothetical protein
MEESILYDYVFHYNTFTKTWAAIPRDQYNAYWSEPNVPGVLRSKSISTLTELLIKTGGDVKKIAKLIREK